MMDKAAIHAAEAFCKAGYPMDAESLLIVELDGPNTEVDYLIDRVAEISKRCGAFSSRVSQTEEERLSFWAGRKAAFPAVGRISPDYYCIDGTIPRARLPEVLRKMTDMCDKHGLRVANVFHAGDGNLHPLLVFDSRIPGTLEKVQLAGEEIVKISLEAGGVLSGEHGIGLEKQRFMSQQFSQRDLEAQDALRRSFDPENRSNPHKVLPTGSSCGEMSSLDEIPEGVWI